MSKRRADGDGYCWDTRTPEGRRAPGSSYTRRPCCPAFQESRTGDHSNLEPSVSTIPNYSLASGPVPSAILDAAAAPVEGAEYDAPLRLVWIPLVLTADGKERLNREARRLLPEAEPVHAAKDEASLRIRSKLRPRHRWEATVRVV